MSSRLSSSPPAMQRRRHELHSDIGPWEDFFCQSSAECGEWKDISISHIYILYYIYTTPPLTFVLSLYIYIYLCDIDRACLVRSHRAATKTAFIFHSYSAMGLHRDRSTWTTHWCVSPSASSGPGTPTGHWADHAAIGEKP